jgi:hypothetical protein
LHDVAAGSGGEFVERRKTYEKAETTGKQTMEAALVIVRHDLATIGGRAT